MFDMMHKLVSWSGKLGNPDILSYLKWFIVKYTATDSPFLLFSFLWIDKIRNQSHNMLKMEAKKEQKWRESVQPNEK